ncbi:LysM peptidoglycan-binding domain-containing protein [Paenibacillus sp. 481]|uniref:LysM peptidoglycan-binding domain-containing protein n=1 Tax=Paenibacillus sp. 481 TaxID=2835869 RepID=UPI001E5B4AB9|nr:LysM domain-containing protein [Paenibacillus sp. 481]UHA71937.1 LysM peptidoglycan-binding domain-containing protein [Paenibacillus sp. 481]
MLGKTPLFVTMEEPQYGVTVSEHNVEKGAPITDHIQKEHTTLRLEGMLLGLDAAKLRQDLVTSMERGQILRYSGRNLFKGCMITSLSTAHDYSIANGMTFSMMLRQVQLVKPEFTKLPPKVKVRLNKKKKGGTKRKAPVKKSTNRSIQKQTYRVASGDSWYTVSIRFATSIGKLKYWNPAIKHQNLRTGMLLAIGYIATPRQSSVMGQPNRTHRVRLGDTWQSIANMYYMPIGLLRDVNPHIRQLKAGDVLNIPTR